MYGDKRILLSRSCLDVGVGRFAGTAAGNTGTSNDDSYDDDKEEASTLISNNQRKVAAQLWRALVESLLLIPKVDFLHFRALTPISCG